MIETMKNAIEKAAIAKSVVNYVIDHLLVEAPMSPEFWANDPDDEYWG
jgi:hypothetical protein